MRWQGSRLRVTLHQHFSRLLGRGGSALPPVDHRYRQPGSLSAWADPNPPMPLHARPGTALDLGRICTSPTGSGPQSGSRKKHKLPAGRNSRESGGCTSVAGWWGDGPPTPGTTYAVLRLSAARCCVQQGQSITPCRGCQAVFLIFDIIPLFKILFDRKRTPLRGGLPTDGHTRHGQSRARPSRACLDP